MRFTGRAYGVATARRANGAYDRHPIIRQIVDRLHVGDSDAEVERVIREKVLASVPKRKVEALVRSAIKRHHENRRLYGHVMGGHSRRPNPPMLAILNPLPAHLERFAKAQRLNADEREEFNRAIARYCEFHDVSPDEIKLEPWGEVEGDATRFLVGLGKAEDVSYSANTKDRFRGSNKKGTPWRHKIEAGETMLATTPDGEMTIIINKPGAKRKMVVQDWLRG